MWLPILQATNYERLKFLQPLIRLLTFCDLLLTINLIESRTWNWPLGMLMDSPRLFPWQQEGPPTWGWNHFLAWDPKLQTWRKGSEHQAAHTPRCFSILGSRGPAVSSPYLLRFPHREKLYLELWGKINPFPLSCPSVLSQKQEKKIPFTFRF